MPEFQNFGLMFVITAIFVISFTIIFIINRIEDVKAIILIPVILAIKIHEKIVDIISYFRMVKETGWKKTKEFYKNQRKYYKDQEKRLEKYINPDKAERKARLKRFFD
ncbi:MAG: hypothetical protein LBI28_04865 [Treponema sp.]|jgi:hypothetical protein|nr:hypothetical protein [Treponema sp.]